MIHSTADLICALLLAPAIGGTSVPSGVRVLRLVILTVERASFSEELLSLSTVNIECQFYYYNEKGAKVRT